MKKNILIVLLILVSAFFALFAKIKANEAEKAANEAQVNLVLAQENAQRADIEMEKALHAAADAVRQQHEAERLMAALQECQSK